MSIESAFGQPNYLDYQGKHGGMLGWVLIHGSQARRAFCISSAW